MKIEVFDDQARQVKEKQEEMKDQQKILSFLFVVASIFVIINIVLAIARIMK